MRFVSNLFKSDPKFAEAFVKEEELGNVKLRAYMASWRGCSSGSGRLGP